MTGTLIDPTFAAAISAHAEAVQYRVEFLINEKYYSGHHEIETEFLDALNTIRTLKIPDFRACKRVVVVTDSGRMETVWVEIQAQGKFKFPQ